VEGIDFINTVNLSISVHFFLYFQVNPTQIIVPMVRRCSNERSSTESLPDTQIQVDFGEKRTSEDHQQLLPTTFKIFPLTNESDQQQQQPTQVNVMCLSIVNGKIQNIRESDQSQGDFFFLSTTS
jgi:hypothetical protein